MTERGEFPWGERLPTLAGDGVRLRWLEDADVPALYEIFGDPEVMRYWSRGPFESLREAEALLGEIRTFFAERSLFQWGIAGAGDEIVGTCTILRVEREHRRCEIGFALARRCWGRGLASRGVARALEFAFEELDVHRVEADADPRNERSLNLLERLGFEREGLLRERYHVGDETQDAVMLGLLRPKWRALEPRRGAR